MVMSTEQRHHRRNSSVGRQCPLANIKIYFLYISVLCLGLPLPWLVINQPWRWLEVWTRAQRNKQLIPILDTFPVQSTVNFSEYELNVSLSNQIPLDRPIPDSRPRSCRSLHFDLNELPKVSIIIPFYDESWSMLLRSIHSIVDRSPPQLIEEIILVDDCSTYPYLGKNLEEYLTALSSKIRISRMRVRVGLIQARMHAAREAKGEVIIFMDAHIECNRDWLPPLLAVIHQNSTTVALPHIDTISPGGIQYEPWHERLQGSLSWNMNYFWQFAPLLKDDDSGHIPISTPVTIGCVIAVNRRFFLDVGAFDEGMNVWGGENIDLSLRTWMCGGSMVIVPCSRVGHMFRVLLPYVFPFRLGGGSAIYKNYQRVVDVWMGSYAKYYYASVQKRYKYTASERASLEKRKQLRDKLGCRDFAWFMKTLVPGLLEPESDSVYSGQLQSHASHGCVSSSLITVQEVDVLPVTHCSYHSRDQQLSLTASSQLVVNGSLCFTAMKRRYVTLKPCKNDHPAQKWIFNETLPLHARPLASPTDHHRGVGRLVNGHHCLVQITVMQYQVAALVPCWNENPKIQRFQLWAFTYSMDMSFSSEKNYS